jgi:single-stranded-DNA-specific exonuclease
MTPITDTLMPLYHPVQKKLVRRAPPVTPPQLDHLSPLIQRIYGTRSVNSAVELDRSLSQLPSPALLSGMDTMTELLADAIAHNRSLLVIGDYDADGATASAVAVRGLRALGLTRVGYLVPNRFEYGYGLTPEIVALAARQQPELLLTVDNGISSIDGVAAANALGIRVLVTDHHLPGAALPKAAAIVNPNLPGDIFPSKALAGVGVMFYVLMALRQRLRSTGHFTQTQTPEPNLATLLDLVALGTVADVVGLDHLNRILVHQGLQRIRSGQAHPGLLALLEVAGRKREQVNASDLGFFAGPRLNAAGRLEDMSLGIECLLTDNADSARAMATQLNDINRDRREIEDQMKADALAGIEGFDRGDETRPALCLFEEDWHQGVVGLVASRIKDRLHRPVIAFALADAEKAELKGSARSIPGIHIRDVLADIATRHPGLLEKFGGHAMAAGLSLARDRLDDFTRAFETEVLRHAATIDLEPTIDTDGALDSRDMSLKTAEALQQAGPWGQNFPEPLFDGEFQVIGSRIVGERHLKLVLKPQGSGEMIDAIVFGLDDPAAWLKCRQLRAAYRLDINDFRDSRSVQLRIEYMEAIERP